METDNNNNNNNTEIVKGNRKEKVKNEQQKEQANKTMQRMCEQPEKIAEGIRKTKTNEIKIKGANCEADNHTLIQKQQDKSSGDQICLLVC